jgi:branched-chain amino acid transport system substrate-binding protein
MKKYLFIAIALVVIAALFLLFMQALGGDEISYKPVKENENKIFIGVYEPLTGINAEGGCQEKLGVMYANSITPTVDIEGVTYDIKLVYADNESDINVAEAAAKSLLNENISAVLGSYGSTVTLIGADVFDAAEIPAIGISCTNPDITTQHKYYYRVCFLDSFQGQTMANYAYSKELRHAAVVTQVGDAYSKGLGEYFAAEFEKLGGTVDNYTFNTVTMNFSGLISQINSSKADFVFMPSPSSSAVMFINQMRENSCMLPIFGGDTWDTASLISGTGTNGTNIFFTSQFDESGEMDISGADFVSKFSTWVKKSDERLELNGGTSEVSPVSVLAYDAYMTVVEAIKAAVSTDPKAINAALKDIEYDGVTGKISFDSNGDCGKARAFFKTINVAEEKFDTLQVSSAK